MAPSRRLDWEALLNARDLGGLPTASGRETRWGAVVRSDSLAALTPAGRDAVLAYGIRTVIDLRLPSELRSDPNPFAARDHHGVAYHNVSFIDPASRPQALATTLAEDYKGMLGRFGLRVAAVVATIAGAPEGGVVIHCAAGKDRTGLIVALLLSTVGVAPGLIAEDYALTAESLQARDEQYLAEGPGERAEREHEIRYFHARPQVMAEVLADLHARFGGAERYLLQAGVRPADLDRLRARLTT
jgi:protein-tyrosine phosphatase